MSIISGVGAGLGGAGDSGGALGSFYGYTLDQSLRFNRSDNTKLHLDPTGSPTLSTKCTISFWFKLSKLGTSQYLFTGETGNVAYDVIQFHSTNKIQVLMQNPNSYGLRTTAVFRDLNAWYHLVLECDSTLSTAADRFKLYINGNQQTMTSVYGNYPQDHQWYWSRSGASQNIGRSENYSNSFDGYFAEFNFIDGSVVAYTEFGETKDGVWIPKQYSGSYGNNGFYLPFSHDKTSEGFTPVLYEGTRAVQSVRGTGFTPDLVWAKRRDGVQEGRITDSVRGVNAQLRPAATNIETTFSNAVTSFDADGFTLGVDHSSGSQSFNYYQDSHVAWCWEAGGAPTATNSAGAGATPTSGSVKIDGSNLGSALAGTIPATKLTANTAKGFSIVSYTGTGSNGTIAHGLSSAPEMIIIKDRDTASKWLVYHKFDGGTDGRSFLNLDVANAKFDNGPGSYFQDTPPTSDVFYQNTSSYNQNTDTYIAYCWHSVSGYSKFSSYTGSGSSGKAVTGLGFRPMFVMIKRTDSSGGWHVFDSVRFPSNPIDKRLEWDNAEEENSDATVDIQFDSDGFTLLTSFDNMNASSGTYIFMAFADTRDSAFYKDSSGNLNNFTPTNVFTRSVVPDSPTNNYALVNPLAVNTSNAWSVSKNNSKIQSSSNNKQIRGNFLMQSGKWYWETRRHNANNSSAQLSNGVGIAQVNGYIELNPYQSATNWSYYSHQGYKYNNNSGQSYGDTWNDAGDIIGVAFDADNGAIWFSKNGTWQNSATASEIAAGTTTNAAYTGLTDSEGYVCVWWRTGGNNAVEIDINFGTNPSFNQELTGSDVGTESGDGGALFKYAPPTGFKALTTSNMPDVTITQGSDNFNTVLYTGNASTLSVTGVGFQPDWVWIKSRAATRYHMLYDVVRGVTKAVRPSLTTAQVTNSNTLTSFDSDGFSVGTDSDVNTAETLLSWNWKAGGSASTIAAGSISTGPDVPSVASTVSANTTAGFSIVQYEGLSSGTQTVGHGLNSAPEYILFKNIDDTSSWVIYSEPVGTGGFLITNSTNGTNTSDVAGTFNSTAPTNNVFTVGTNNAVGGNGETIIAYCFHSVEGYSKIGTFQGNSDSNGTFVYLGFRPAWVLIKSTSSGTSWCIFDSKRLGYNVDNNLMRIGNVTEQTDDDVDFVSNGLKFRRSSTNFNNSSHTYVYLALAEAPFKFSNAR